MSIKVKYTTEQISLLLKMINKWRETLIKLAGHCFGYKDQLLRKRPSSLNGLAVASESGDPVFKSPIEYA